MLRLGIIHWCSASKTFHNKTLIELHTDGGGEYKGAQFQKYLADEGIEHTTTMASTPQHNPFAERMNRTLFESMRSMLSHSGLPKIFWGDAVLYAIHIRNRCLASVDDSRSPYELWTGKKPDLSHIRVFGCDAYMHVKDSDRKKLDDKSIECVMIGYCEKKHGYKLWGIKEKKLYYSRDVEFDEQSFKHAAIVRAENSEGELVNENYFSPLDSERNEEGSGMLDDFEAPEEKQRPVASAPVEEVISYDDLAGDEVVERKEEQRVEQEQKRADPAPVPARLSREARALMRDSVHPMFEGPSEERRRGAQVDRGAIITDSHQLKDYANPVISSDPQFQDHEVQEYCFMSGVVEPTSYDEAMKSEDAREWNKATSKEYQSLIDNQTWKKCKIPDGRKAIGCKWVYKVKINKDGGVERYKARLVAKGYSQKEGIDYNETFAPVLKYKSLRILLAIAAIKDLEVKQMDVETAFLNAPIKEEVYMEQPEGYHDGDDSNVLLLQKTLYGTKQAPHEWNNTLNEFIVSIDFTRCLSDTCTYMKMSKNNYPIIIAVFVDDIIIIYDKQDEKEWVSYKERFMKTFKMKDLNDAEWILGIRVKRDREVKTIHLDHEVQVQKTLESFRMSQVNSCHTPSEVKKFSMMNRNMTNEEKELMKKIPFKSLIGSLQYIALSTRPDIAYAVNQLSRFLSDPGQEHWMGGKRVLRYLKGTAKMGLLYKNHDGSQKTKIEVYCDADWAGDVDDRKSTTGIVIKLNGCPVVWLSKKQQIVALSTAEAEYIAIATATQEVIWINNYLSEIKMKDELIPIIYSDNQAAIQIASNDTLHSRSKHIDIRYHFIRQMIQEEQIKLEWISTKEQQADINTKNLTMSTYVTLRDKLMCNSE